MKEGGHVSREEKRWLSMSGEDRGRTGNRAAREMKRSSEIPVFLEGGKKEWSEN